MADQRDLAGLVEELRADQRQRWLRGDRVFAESYAQQHPELAANEEAFLDFIYGEYCLREELKEPVRPQEYFERFPQFAERLKPLFEVHQAMVAGQMPDLHAQCDGSPRRFPVHLNCPHCRNPIEIVADSPDEEVVCPSCGSSFKLDPDRTQSWSKDKLPTLGKFELIEVVGRGAFGTVYKARDKQLQRVVAVKVPRSGQLATDEDEDRFVREARNAAQLQHRGIVPVYEVGRSETFPYIVSEFVQGFTLSDALSDRRFGFREAAQLVALVAEALQHAHAQGVVHRDLKPSNIMLTADGTPRVMDFGLAKRDAGEITVTVEGQVLGTPAYMSPEQASGQAHHVDGRSDVYSLGVILFELLTGELPFRGNQRMLLHHVIHDEPRAPRSLNDRIPRDLETICLKAMAKEPGRRYQNAHAMADDLNRWSSGQPIMARPVSHIERGWRWCRRNPVVASLSALVALALVSGIGVSSYFAIRATAERNRADAKAAEAEANTRMVVIEKLRADAKTKEAEGSAQVAIKEKQRADETADKERTARAEAERNAERALKEKEHSRRLLYAADINLAQHAWSENHPDRVSQLLEQHVPKENEQDLRGWEWHYQKALLHSDLRTLQGHKTVSLSICFSQDGQRLASAGGDNRIKLWDVEAGALLRTLDTKTTSRITSISFGPGGQQLASGCDDGTITLWSLETGGELHTLKGHSSSIGSIAISPDSRRAASTDDRMIKLWDLETGAELRTIGSHSSIDGVCFSPDCRRLASTGRETITLWDAETGALLRTLKKIPISFSAINRPSFSPDGRMLASANGVQTITLWDTESGTELRTLNGHAEFVNDVSFSPDGRILASASADRTIRLWDAATGADLGILRGHTNGVFKVSFSSDGRMLASISSDETIKLWKTESRFELRGDALNIRSVSFSSDGHRLASADINGTVKHWDIESGADLRTLRVKQTNIFAVSFSPDGQRLASGGDDGTITLWDAETGAELCTLKGHTKHVWNISFSPDGRRLASASDDRTTRLWDATTGTELRALKSAPANLSFSPDGRRLACGSSQTIKLWDVETGAQLRTLTGHTKLVWSVLFSPDGRRLASTSSDETIKIWDMETGAELFTLNVYTPDVRSISFSPDGQRLVSGGGDGLIKLWDVETGALLCTLTGHKVQGPYVSNINYLAFSPDGRRLVSVSGNTIKLWDAILLTPDEKMARGVVEDLLERVLGAGEVVKEIRSKTAWNDRMRTTAVAYAQSPSAAGVASGRLIDQARRAFLAHDWEQTNAVLANAAKLRELPPDVQNVRSDALAMLTKWREAAYFNARPVGATHHVLETLLRDALLQLASGNEAGYRVTCEDMLKSGGDTDQPFLAFKITVACVVGDDAVQDMGKVTSLAKQAKTAFAPGYSTGMMWLGAAQFRAGQTVEAIAALKDSLPGHNPGGSAAPNRLDLFSQLFGETILALAYKKQGDKESLGKQVAVVNDLIVQLEESPPNPSQGLLPPWAIPFAIEIAKRELAKLSPPADETK